MKTFETEAIVLSTRDHGESDRLVAFHTADCGRLRGIAKGARRSKKRFVNTFEPGNLVELECREKNSFTGSKPASSWSLISRCGRILRKWAYAALFSEIILEMVPEGERTAGHFSSPQGDPWQVGKRQGPFECSTIGTAAISASHGIYAGPGRLCGLPARLEDRARMVLAVQVAESWSARTIFLPDESYMPSGYGNFGAY